MCNDLTFQLPPCWGFGFYNGSLKKKKEETLFFYALQSLFHPNKKGHELIDTHEYNFKNLPHQGLHGGGCTLGIELM